MARSIKSSLSMPVNLLEAELLICGLDIPASQRQALRTSREAWVLCLESSVDLVSIETRIRGRVIVFQALLQPHPSVSLFTRSCEWLVASEGSEAYCMGIISDTGDGTADRR